MTGLVLVRGGTIVTAAGMFDGDVLIADGIIADIGRLDAIGPGCRVIDATDRYVLPGGVDPHTHIDSPLGETVTSDDYVTGTTAAAMGGTTTVVNFIPQIEGVPLQSTLDAWWSRSDGRAVIDHSFHLALRSVNYSTIRELGAVFDAGVSSFKVYMAYPNDLMLDDGSILDVLRNLPDGALCCVHAENGHMIERLQQSVPSDDRGTVAWHARTRPAIAESEAVHRAASLASIAGVPVYLVHVSSARAMEEVCRPWPVPVLAETCTHYLLLDESRYDDIPERASRFVMSPPLRGLEDQDRLWTALAEGDLQVVSSDHCPTCVSEKLRRGRTDFTRIPNGSAGVTHRLVLLHTYGVCAGRLTLPRLVDVWATTPARIFGMYPRKGTVAIGSDADLVVFDPSARGTIPSRPRSMRVDHDPFDGFDTIGAVETVIARGDVIVDRGSFVGRAGRGSFIARGACGSL